MGYNYSTILEETNKLIRMHALILIGFLAAASFIIILLCAAGILPKEALWSFLGMFPAVCAVTVGTASCRKKTADFAKKQQISIMAFQAKKAINFLRQEFPDTFLSDAQISMRYLARNGINVDSALKKLDGNVDAYNQRVLSFLGESDRLEDELFDLMQDDTILQYGHMAHALRLRVSELGVLRLADTAFFHEIEAYAENIDVVRDNWEKLSFELDETYHVFFEYIKSLGLENASGKEDCRMTCKRWSERLQEACNALEAYNTIEAKKILSELIKYQIDAGINNTLQGIITNIDEIMAN